MIAIRGFAPPKKGDFAIMKTLLRRILPLGLAAALLLGLGACSLPFVGDDGWSWPWGGGNGERAFDDRVPFEGVDFSDYIELGDYIGISGDFLHEALLDIVRGIFEQQGFPILDIDPDESRTVVEEGDNIIFDFSGYVEGLGRFENGTAENHVMLDVGAGSFIPGFEEQLIGQEIGVAFDVTVTFPEVYPQNEELAGQEAVFTCTIHAIGEPIPGIPSDDLIAQLTQGEIETLDEFLAQMLEDMDEGEIRQRSATVAFNAALANATFLALPEAEVEHFRDVLLWQLDEIAEESDMTHEEILQFEGFESIDEFMEAEVLPGIERELFAYAIAELEGIVVTDEDLDEFLAEMRDMHPMETADWDDDELTEQLGGRSRLLRHLLVEAVGEFIYDNAV